MSVLSREALEASPLADLHAIASELAIDGFRRIRKADLVDAILERADGLNGRVAGDADDDAVAVAVAEAEAEAEKPRRRTRGGRGRTRKAVDADPDADAEADAEAEARLEGAVAEAALAPDGEAEDVDDLVSTEAHDVDEEIAAEEAEAEDRRRTRRARGGRGRSRAEEPEEAEPVADGRVELAGNGAAFLRLEDQPDVYVSAAQVRRCELVDGDRVSGPVRRPRRSERYPSLVRVDTINGAAAAEVAVGTPFDELPAAWPSERFAFGSEDPTLKAIEWLTPFGRGSRVVLAGPARTGKSEAVRRLAAALAGQDDLEVSVVLLGARPEEVHEWSSGEASGGVVPAASLTFAAAADAQGQALDRAVETARRVAARGGHAVLLVDALDGVHAPAARKALAAARAIPDGGSLTVVAGSTRPLGGETTVVSLDPALAATGDFPAIDLRASGTLRPERLVGEAGAEAIAKARAEAAGGAAA